MIVKPDGRGIDETLSSSRYLRLDPVVQVNSDAEFGSHLQRQNGLRRARIGKCPDGRKGLLPVLKYTGSKGNQLPGNGTYSKRTTSQEGSLRHEVQADLVSLVSLHFLQHPR